MFNFREKDLLDVEFAVRCQHVLRALRMSWTEWICMTALLTSDRHISENSLACIIGMPRTTVRGYIEDVEFRGYVRRDQRQGLVLTPVGRCLAKNLVTEALGIVRGDRVGFKDWTITTLIQGQRKVLQARRKRAKPLVFKELQTLRFSPRLVYDVEFRHPGACPDQAVDLSDRQSDRGS